MAGEKVCNPSLVQTKSNLLKRFGTVSKMLFQNYIWLIVVIKKSSLSKSTLKFGIQVKMMSHICKVWFLFF